MRQVYYEGTFKTLKSLKGSFILRTKVEFTIAHTDRRMHAQSILLRMFVYEILKGGSYFNFSLFIYIKCKMFLSKEERCAYPRNVKIKRLTAHAISPRSTEWIIFNLFS